MNNLLKMATDSERQLRGQVSDTEKMLKLAFSEHERSVNEALRSSEKTISAAIAAHTQGLSEAMQSHRQNVLRLVARTWTSILITTALLLGGSGSALWYTGSLVTSNLVEIKAQSATLAKLESKTWGLEYQEGRKGRFLVLPKGMMAESGWSVGEGKTKQNAVKLVKE